MKGRAISYEPEELAWIEARKEWPRADLHRAFVNSWQRPEVSQDSLKQLCLRRGWKTGRTGCFVKGQTSHNKGKSMTPEVRAKCAATMFKKGQVSHTYRGPGHERIDSKDGYVVMIVEETNPWTGARTRPVHKHRYLWEKENGPIPKGHVLKCLDGDKTNCNPSNWELVSQAMLPRLNGRWTGLKYDDAAPEVRPALMAIARLDHAARKARKAER